MKNKSSIKKIIIISMTLAFAMGATNTSAQQLSDIGKGILHILGIALSVDPIQQTAPVNMETTLNTELLLPDVDPGGDIPGAPQDLLVVAELTGPGLTEPKTIAALPGEQLMIPPLPQEGTYVLDNIRLMSGDQVVLYAEPSMALIDTIRKLLITQVTSRALSIDEIEELGITINPENFTAYKFTVGFGTETGDVRIEIPVIVDNSEDDEPVTNYVIKNRYSPPSSNPVPKFRKPRLIAPFKLGLPPTFDRAASSGLIPPIAGVIVIPGDIAFLNQFFEVMLLIANNAPDGSNLTVTDISAALVLPAGDDNMPGSLDDPLRVAKTDIGQQAIVPVFNTIDGGRELSGQESGEGRLLVEGLKEGTHKIIIDITATLLGLPSGPVRLTGKTYGTVAVRNPYFTLAFGQPDVVREGEEYSLFVTVNNTSEADANLVNLTLPSSEVYGATIVGDSDPNTPVGTVQIRTISAGDSAVAEFKLIARKTGKVTSTAFVGDEGARGIFQLRTGVDERGVPLSPDTIILSEYTKNLPEDLVYHAMRVLGLAHGVATAPVLPPEVTRIPGANVAKRAYELTEAGLRVKMGEPLENSAADLLMDWLGNGFRDKGFEEILRTTDAGRDFLLEAGKILAQADKINLQRAFGQVVKYREPFISAMVENVTDASAYLEVTDAGNLTLGRRNDGTAVREIPYGVLVDLDGDEQIHQADMALLDSQTGNVYDLNVRAMKTGMINIGLVLPDGGGGFIHVVYRNLGINAGETVTGQIVAGSEAPVLKIGTSNIYPTEVYTYDSHKGPSVISAMQLPEADPHDRGRVVAVLFDEKIDPESMNNPDNYEIVYRTLDKNLINAPKLAKILPGNRIIEIKFECTISPFFEYDLILSGITDPDINPIEPEPVRVPIINTFTKPGGIVSGTVRKGNGDIIPYAEVVLWEYTNGVGKPFKVITNRTVTDADGIYQLDFVALGDPFSIESSNPETGQAGKVSSRIIMDRQRQQLDLLLLGLGNLTGQVVMAADSTPIEGAVVKLKSLTTTKEFYALTDTDGRFSMTMVPVGNVNLVAEFGSFKGAMGVNVPQVGASIDVSIPVYSTLENTGSVKGRVFGSDGKTPVAGVPVIVSAFYYRDWIESDSQGNFLLEDVPAGDVSVYSFKEETGEEARASFVVQSNETSTVNLIFPGTAKIIGSVYEHTGEPLAGATIVSGVNLLKSDEHGNFVIEDVPTGSVKVEVQHPVTAETLKERVAIGSPGEVARMTITFPAPELKGTIQGYARDAYGNPLMYHTILFRLGSFLYSTSTDGAGFYSKELPLGNVSTIIVNSDGTDADNKRVRLGVDGQVINLGDLQFKGFASVTGTVYMPDGVSPTVANVIFTRKFFTPLGGQYTREERYISDQLTDEGLNGKFTIEKVRMGDFRLESYNAFYSQPAVYTGNLHNPDETVDIDIVLQPTSTVRGQIFLANGDRAGAGVTVTLKSISITEMQVSTRDDGSFQFDLVPPELFWLEAYDPLTGNYGIARGSVETGDEAVVDINILGKGTVHVKVIDGAGDPIQNARVWLNSGSKIAYLVEELPTLYSDQNGEVVFSYVPEGGFSVTAEDPGTLTGGKSGGTIPEDNTEVDVTVIASSSGTVSGTIFTADETEIVPYAQIKLQSMGRYAFYTTSDASGTYIFDYVPLGSFTIEIFHPATARVGKAAASVSYDTQKVTVDVRLIAQGTVEGYVYTAGGEPVSMASVSISSNDISGFGSLVMTSNLEGRYKASGIPEGQYTVIAKDPFMDLSGIADGEITSEGELVQTDVYLEPAGEITGKTTSADGITPVPYAEVKVLVSSRYLETVSDGDGIFTFETIPLGTYQLSALEQDGFDGGYASVTISFEGEIARADIVFTGTGNIIGRVEKTDGSPPEKEAKITMQSNGPMGGSFVNYTDLDGNFAFYGVPNGEFSISVKVPGSILGGAYNGNLEQDGQTLDNVVVIIEPSGAVEGTVFRQDGITPVKEGLIFCRVAKTSGGNVTVYTLTGENGDFTIDSIPLGQFNLTANDYTFGGSGKASGELTDAASTITLEPIILDESNPYVVNVTPGSGSVQVPLGSVITVEFSEPVDSYYLNSDNISVTGGAEPISGHLSLSSDRTIVTFTPSDLLPEFSPITIAVKSMRDDRGKIMEDSVLSTFTTADVTPPQVLSGRLIKGAFVAGFSEPVIQETGAFVVTNTITAEPVEGILTFSADDMVATLYPSATLPDNVAFKLVISGYTDSFDNIQLDEFRATYITGDKEPPVITLSSSDAVVIEGTSVIITALPVNTPDLFIVDYRVNGQLVVSVNKAPFEMTILPTETVEISAVPTDYAGNVGQEVSFTIDVLPNELPTASIISPVDGITTGTGYGVSVRVEATDDLGLKEIEMRVRSTDISTTKVYKLSSTKLAASTNFSFSIPSSSKPAMPIDIEIVARDIRDVESIPATITIITEDTTRPLVNITSFERGFQVVPGEVIPVNIFASDNAAVSAIDFKTEGGLQIFETYVVDPPTLDAVGMFTLTIPQDYSGGTKITVAPSATDVNGNVGYSRKITLTIEDVISPTVELLSPATGDSITARDTTAVSVSAIDNDVIDRVDFYIDEQLFATDKYAYKGVYNAAFVAPAKEGRVVNLSAKSYDKSGNVSDTAMITLYVVKDAVLPEVNITSNLSALKFAEEHIVDIRAYASDNVDVTLVELFVNNVLVSSTENPLSNNVTLEYFVENLIPSGSDSIQVPLEVRATDPDGNTGSSGVYMIDIIHDNPPDITILSPQPQQNVTGGASIYISGEATDDFGISSYEIRVNGTTVSQGAGASFSTQYRVPEFALGSEIVIEVVAVDTLGNSVTDSINVHVPFSASLAGEIQTGGEVTDVVRYGSHAYVLKKTSGVSVIDISDAAMPVETSSISIQGYYSGIDSFEGVVYVYGASGITLIDVFDAANPLIIGSHDTPAPVKDMAFRAGYAYAAMGSQGVLILDVHNPAMAEGVIHNINNVESVDADGDYLYIAHKNISPRLSVYSLADPLVPSYLYAHNTGALNFYDAEGISGIGITANNILTAFAFDDADGFSTLSDLIVRGSSLITSLDLRGRYATQVSGTRGWGLVEITDSGGLYDMGLIGSEDATYDAVFAGGHIFTAEGAGGLRIYKLDSVNALVPEVQITSHIFGDSVEEGSEIDVVTEVVNNDNAVVTFFVDGKEMFTDESAPYSYRFRVPSDITSLTLTARAVNISGDSALSPEVILNVLQETDPPTLTITYPMLDGTVPMLIEGETLVITGTASDNFSIKNVELYVDGILADYTLFSDFTLEYPVPLDSIEGTDYQSEVLVRATDVSGNITEAVFFINVIEDNPPEVTFITPQANAVVYGGLTITLSVSAWDDSAISEVRFYEDGSFLGTGQPSLTDVYSFYYKMPDVTVEETRAFSVEAVDSSGQVSSAEISVIIKPPQTGPVVSVGSNAETIDIQNDIAVTGGSDGTISIYNIGIPTSPVFLGSLDVGSEIRQIRMFGNRIYATESYRARVVDMSDPVNPVELSNIYIGRQVYSIDVFNDLAFIGADNGYIQIRYLGDGTSPVQNSFIDLGNGVVRDLKVDGQLGILYALVDNGAESYVSILDIMDFNNLSEIGRLLISGTPRRMNFEGDQAYIVNNSGVVIVDMSNPLSPQFIGNFDTPGTATDIELLGNFAYVSDGETFGLSIIDISDPALPVHISSIDTPGSAMEVAQSQGLVFVADGLVGLTVVEVGDTPPVVRKNLITISNLKTDETIDIIGQPMAITDEDFNINVTVRNLSTNATASVYINSGEAFIVNITASYGNELELEVFDSSQGSGPLYLGRVPVGEVLSNYPVTGIAQVVDVMGDLAVVGDDSGNITIFDVTEPLSPIRLGSQDIGSEIRQVRIIGSIVYATESYNARIIDISDPANPVELSNIYFGRYAYSIDIFNDLAFIGTSSGFIYVYYVGDAANPLQSSYIDIGNGTISDIKVDGLAGILYAAVDNGADSYMSVLDINSLEEIGRVAIPGRPGSIELVGDNAYLAVETGMVIVSLNRLGKVDFGTDGDSDGMADDILSYFETTGGAYDIEIRDNYAYIADGMFNGIVVADITNPELPVEISKIRTSGDARGIEIEGGYLYLADGYLGLSVVRSYTAEAGPALEFDLVSVEVRSSTATVAVIGSYGAVTDDEYPVIVSVESVLTRQIYEAQVYEADNGAFRIELPWIAGDDLYISLTESTQNLLTVGPFYLGRVPVGEVLSNYPVNGIAQVVDVMGDLAVVGDDSGNITIFNVTEPLSPIRLGSLDIGSEIRQVRIIGHIVYATESYNARIIDISDPANPVELSNISFGRYTYNIDIFNDLAFIGVSSGLIYVYYVGDTANPLQSSSIDIGNGTIRDIKVDGPAGILYAAVDNGADSYMSVLDINSFEEIGRVAVPGRPGSIELVGDNAYLAVGTGMVIVSLNRLGKVDFGTDGDSDGMADDILSYFETTGGAYDIEIRDNYAYIADGVFNGIVVADITNPELPVEVSKIRTAGDARGIEIEGGYLYLADGYVGLSIVELY